MRARKRFGQHFLVPAWADKLVSAIDPGIEDRFLEIGPGAGALTLRLAALVQHVTAVEIDRDLVQSLLPELPSNVTLIEADFRRLDLDPLVAAGPVRVVGNLPYNVASPILFRLIDTWRRHATSAGHPPGRPWIDATLMVQLEVADRIEAGPGSRDYGVLSIGIQLHADVHRVLTLPPGAFRPMPKVHSAVLRLSFRPPAVAITDEALFHQMIRSVFTQRRKTLGNALGPFAVRHEADPRAVLEEVGIEPGRRAETLQLAELARLANYFVGRSANN